MLKSRIKVYYRNLVKGVYSIGFLDYNAMLAPHQFKFSDVRWINMNGYKHGWFADPFVLEANDDEIILLVEEFEYHNEKGRLCKIRVSKQGYKLIEVIPILTLDTHLSYPSIYRRDGKIYVCPENGEAGVVKVYELENDQLVNPKIIIDQPLVDTQLLELNSKFYAFGVCYDLRSQNATKTLQIYESDDFFGPYHHIQTIENNKCEERGAGNICINHSRIIRPAQVCEDGYGRGIVLYTLRYKDGKFEEKECGRIVGDFWKRWGVGIHQIHTHENLTVIDGRDFINCLVGILKRYRNYFQHIPI